MKRVTGIAGFFFSAKDPVALQALVQAASGNRSSVMVLEKTDDLEYGKFGWVMDPEGNKVEL